MRFHYRTEKVYEIEKIDLPIHFRSDIVYFAIKTPNKHDTVNARLEEGNCDVGILL